jgi:hypothetical protein
VDLGHHFPPKAVACIPSVEIAHPKEYVAYHLPGENKWLAEFATRYGIPLEAARGGADTMYPEYQEKMAAMPPPPKPTRDKVTTQ